MTVLPNAPIDADTGLPVPTIAVATDGGVSIINNDRTVASRAEEQSNMDTSQIEFTGNGSAYFYTHSWGGAGHDARLVFVKDGNEKSTVAIPYNKSDSNYATFETPLPDGRFTQSNLTLNRFFVNNSAASVGVYNGPTQLTKNSAGSYTGITNFDPDYELANYTSSTINTGWLRLILS